jgi:anaerobic selenocysteine-containing dehydrogenase
MEARSFCRMCHGMCAMIVTIEDGKVVKVRGDRDSPGTRGFACIKGLQNPEWHHGPGRIRRPLRRAADGVLRTIGSAQALDEVAEIIAATIEKHGPRSFAIMMGTQAAYNILHYTIAPALLRAIGSPSLYGTMTIDQSAKWVTRARMGGYAGGRPHFGTGDIWLLCGTNHLVSLQGGLLGIDPYDPVKRLREARAQGLKLIVIDPVRTQTAQNADVFLQPVPGEDPTILAALIRIVLTNSWQDREFCDRYVAGLDELRAAVDPFTPAYAARRAGLKPEELERAAEMFALSGRHGMAASGTGPCMAPHSNLADHLIETLNAICGKFPRPGDRVPNPGVTRKREPVYAEVMPPDRTWERTPRSRVGDYGTLCGQMMTNTLPDEILIEGEGRVRVLIAAGSNPAAALPDQDRILKALRALDLLVTAEPRMSETARLAHYVFAPRLPFERPDHTGVLEGMMREPFAHYTPPIIEPEPDMDLIDDWQLYWTIGKRLGVQLRMFGEDVPMDRKPSTEELLALAARSGGVPYDEVRTLARNGHIFDIEPLYVEPPRPGRNARLELLPADVADEILAVLAHDAGAPGGNRPFQLVVRRTRETINTMGREFSAIRARMPQNLAYMHPKDVSNLGLDDGARIRITSDRDSILGVVKADGRVRPGVVSMTHGWGGLPGDTYEEVGSNTTRLVDSGRRETINAMPRMSAIPVSIVAADAP